MHCGRKNERRELPPTSIVTNNNAGEKSNFIKRFFVVNHASVYQHLFRTCVLPILNYCTPVREPRLKEDRSLKQNVCDRYRRRIASKCNLGENEIEKIDSQKKYLSMLIVRCSSQSVETTTSVNTSSIGPYRKRGQTVSITQNLGRDLIPSTRFSHGV